MIDTLTIDAINKASESAVSDKSEPFKMQATGKSIKNSCGKYFDLGHLDDETVYLFTCLNDLLKENLK